MCLFYFGRWLIGFVPTTSMFVILSWQLALLAIAHQKALLRKFVCTKPSKPETWLRDPPPKRGDWISQGHICGCHSWPHSSHSNCNNKCKTPGSLFPGGIHFQWDISNEFWGLLFFNTWMFSFYMDLFFSISLFLSFCRTGSAFGFVPWACPEEKIINTLRRQGLRKASDRMVPHFPCTSEKKMVA